MSPRRRRFTAQVALLYLVALKLAQIRETLPPGEIEFILDFVYKLPTKIQAFLDGDHPIEEIAQRYHDAHFFLYLGRHIGLPVALEGALKLKEISYIPTEAYSAGEMKHGPIALLDEQTPVVVVATNIHVYDKIVSNIQEVRARGAHVIAIATDGNEDIQHHADDVIYVPKTPAFLQVVLAILPLQLLAYQHRASPRPERRPAAEPRQDRHRRVASPSMAKVLILAGDAAEDLETMYVKYRLLEAGHEPYVAAPTTRPIKLVVHDFEPDFDTYVEKPGRSCPVDIAFADVDPASFAAVVIPGVVRPSSSASIRRCGGSSSTSSRRTSPWARSATGRRFPPRSGFCAGGARPGFGPLAPDIELAGGEYVDGAAVVDGNMVSCRGWGDLAEWSRAFLDVLDRAAVPA